MELWIRSQDKSNLKKVNNIYVEKIEKDFDSWIGNIYSRPYVITSDEGNLGFYATKERALEVLDEIQALLKPKVLLNSGKILGSFEDTIYREPDKVEIQELSTIVYEMPKE